MNAIGRALLQMQQGGQNQQTPGLASSNQQIFLTRASSTTESDVATQNGRILTRERDLSGHLLTIICLFICLFVYYLWVKDSFTYILFAMLYSTSLRDDSSCQQC